jgi:HEAT repeat protein
MSDSDRIEYESRLRNDPRCIEELISVALRHTADDDAYWDAVGVLQRRDTEDALNRHKELCQSSSPAKRRLGADILGQLGVPERTFPQECTAVLLGMLDNEESYDVIQAVLIGLGHLKQVESIEPACRFRKHSDPEIRHGVVFCLLGHEHPKAVETLIEMSKDEDAYVRDWATFGLGAQIDLDTPAIRDALADRLSDEDDDTRHEAMAGLAKRKDRRVIAAISKGLSLDNIEKEALEAAAVLADPEIYPLLATVYRHGDADEELLKEAMKACNPLNTQKNAIG